MPNKKLLIGLSVVIAVLLLLLTLLLGGPHQGGQEQGEVVIDPAKVYTGEAGNPDLPLGQVEGFVYEVREQGILFFADRVVPKREATGVIDVIRTTIQVHMAPGREMTIDAEEGTIVAPDMHPQEGELRGDVVITLYETPDGGEVDLDSDRHVVTRIYFDEPVEFDLELQQVDSVGPIFLTGPQVQMHARGLSLNYNQLKQRIERLVIEEGESLRYIPDPVAPSDDAPAFEHAAEVSAPAVDTESQEQPQRRRVADADEGETEAAATDAEPADAEAVEETPTGRPVQYYLAKFEQLRDVRVAEDQVVMTGDELSAQFSTKAAREKEQETAVSGLVPPVDTREAVKTELASADVSSEAMAYALSVMMGQMPEGDARSLATFTDEDVVITWDGRLTVTPLSETPAALAGPDDVVVTIHGEPATIKTDKGETLLAAEHSFSSKNASLHSKGRADALVSIEAPDLGTLSGLEVNVDQAHANGYVLGPGKLIGVIDEDSDDTALGTTRLASQPRTITVDFRERLNLAFYLKDQPAEASGGLIPSSDNKIKGVKTAEFLGDVTVDHDELAMRADSLTLALLEDAPDNAPEGSAGSNDKMAVDSLTAAGNIEAQVKTEDVRIRADRLAANPALDQLELFGTPDEHATVIRPDATLAGEHIQMDENAGTVDIPGPGSFSFLPDPDDPGKTILVTWVTSMHYDDKAGTARFLGDVRTVSTDGTDTNELMGNDLAMWFEKDETADAPADPNDRTSGRRLAKATMDGNVRYRARSYATDEHVAEQLQTELYLRGEKMVFTDPGLSPSSLSDSTEGAVQMVRIPGSGNMLITDYREKAVSDATPSGSKDAIDMSGRGRTAFRWDDGLDLDLTNGDMVMKGAVLMVHQPEDGEEVRLFCTDLAAELKQPEGKTKGASGASGGDGWLSEDAPQPELDRVWADGGIQIERGPVTVTCDHLLYQEAKRVVILWSDAPNEVVYVAEGEPTPTRSSALKWHRDTGRVEAFELRTGTIPLRRGKTDQ